MSIKIGEKKILRSPLEPKDRNWLWLKTVAGFPVLHEYLSGKWVPFSDATAEYMETHILSRVFGSTRYDKDNHCIEFYAADGSEAPIGVIDTSEFEVSIDTNNYYTKAEVEEYVSEYVSEHGGDSVDLSNYYTKPEVDVLVGGSHSYIAKFTMTVGVGTVNYSCNRTISNLNTAKDSGKVIIGTLGHSVGVLLYCEQQCAVFLFSDTYGELFQMCYNGSWYKQVVETGGSSDIEIDSAPTENSENAVSSGGVFLALDNKVDKVSGKGLSTNDYTTAEKTKLAGIAAGAEVNVQSDWNQTTTTADDYIKNKPTIPSKTSDLTNDSGFTSNAGTITGITMNGTSKGTSGVVDLGTVITAHQDISGKANTSDVYTKTQADTLLAGKLSKSDVSVETQGDGTVDINVKDDTYTVNLNHTHENMAKLIVCEESDLPSTLDPSTIYAQVDDAETPTEIQSLWIAGLEFVGGGGSEDDGMPKMSTPKDGNTINMGTYSGSAMTKVITVRAKNLNYGGSTTGLTVEAVGTGLTLTYGQTTGTSVTIPQIDAMISAQLTINYSGTGPLSDGELRFKQGSSVLAVVVVVVEIPSELVQDTAWCAASGEHFSAPETQAGYCTTPFYQLTHDANRNLDYIVKAGYVAPTDLERGMFVVKTNLADARTQGAYMQSSDPRRRQVKDSNPNQINYLSATFKMSEWADCYIYDFIAGAYLFAGANVDTSTPPQ